MSVLLCRQGIVDCCERGHNGAASIGLGAGKLPFQLLEAASRFAGEQPV